MGPARWGRSLWSAAGPALLATGLIAVLLLALISWDGDAEEPPAADGAAPTSAPTTVAPSLSGSPQVVTAVVVEYRAGAIGFRDLASGDVSGEFGHAAGIDELAAIPGGAVVLVRGHLLLHRREGGAVLLAKDVDELLGTTASHAVVARRDPAGGTELTFVDLGSWGTNRRSTNDRTVELESGVMPLGATASAAVVERDGAIMALSPDGSHHSIGNGVVLAIARSGVIWEDCSGPECVVRSSAETTAAPPTAPLILPTGFPATREVIADPSGRWLYSELQHGCCETVLAIVDLTTGAIQRFPGLDPATVVAASWQLDSSGLIVLLDGRIVRLGRDGTSTPQYLSDATALATVPT